MALIYKLTIPHISNGTLCGLYRCQLLHIVAADHGKHLTYRKPYSQITILLWPVISRSCPLPGNGSHYSVNVCAS